MPALVTFLLGNVFFRFLPHFLCLGFGFSLGMQASELMQSKKALLGVQNLTCEDIAPEAIQNSPERFPQC